MRQVDKGHLCTLAIGNSRYKVVVFAALAIKSGNLLLRLFIVGNRVRFGSVTVMGGVKMGS